MLHVSEINGKTYEIGLIVDNASLKSYDIITIMDFSDLDDIKIVGFYYGDYDYNITEEYIRKFLENN
ncbi:hypothetical protein AALB39_04305 [Lachnospiraceae bacterium 54-53]